MAGICHLIASSEPLWSPVHCTAHRCAPAQPSTIQAKPRALLYCSMPLCAVSQALSA